MLVRLARASPHWAVKIPRMSGIFSVLRFRAGRLFANRRSSWSRTCLRSLGPPLPTDSFMHWRAKDTPSARRSWKQLNSELRSTVDAVFSLRRRLDQSVRPHRQCVRLAPPAKTSWTGRSGRATRCTFGRCRAFSPLNASSRFLAGATSVTCLLSEQTCVRLRGSAWGVKLPTCGGG